VSIIIKYLKYLSAGHWVKIAVPLFMVGAIVFLRSTLEDMPGNLISKAITQNRDKININLDNNSKAFAVAIAKNDAVPKLTVRDYSDYRNREFIKKQINDIYVVNKMNESDRSKSSSSEAPLPPAPEFRVSTIFIGTSRRFAVVNDNVVRIGDALTSGEQVVAIEDGKVLLKGRWGDRWLFVSY